MLGLDVRHSLLCTTCPCQDPAAVPLAVTSRPLRQLCPWGVIGRNKSCVFCWMINTGEEGPAEELRLEESKARGPMKAQVEDLRKQLKAKSRIIQSLKEEIKTPLFQSAQKKNEVVQWRPCRSALGQVILALAEETRSTAFFFLKSDFAVLEQRFLQNLQRCNEGDAKAKLQASEEKVNSQGLEVSPLKSKLQEKTEQSQQLQDQILKQQEALSRASQTLKDTRKAAGNKIY
ncbi:hypothetical protein G5714_023428 [Onychostoma macrolepis]|uniref:Uncharacterized protein n=1 Tax=Onychostoma macrolepis TaxID=369639 RepID=A0A7J6BNH8_9TELE|nr:hypothetical protein G5714_023428 [Onychostoma macrolepis]